LIIQKISAEVKVVRIFICLLFYFFCLSGVVLAENPLPLLVIERDVPIYIGDRFIVNHTTYVVNLSESQLETNLSCFIPERLYRKEDTFFGKEVQLDLSMYYPQQVEIKEYHELGEPKIEKIQDKIVFSWKGVTLPPHEAAIVQYENYLGPESMFYTPEGFNFSGLKVKTRYQCSLDNTDANFFLHYDLENGSGHKVEFLQFEVFFPDTIMMAGKEGKDVSLLEVTGYCMSSNALIQKWVIEDGFGNQTQSHGVFSQKRFFNPGEKLSFFVSFSGKKKTERGEIYPLIILRCRIQGVKLFEPIMVESERDISVGRFYYTEYATSIPDKLLFKLEKDKIEVVPAEIISRPTYTTVIPEIKKPLTGPVPPLKMQLEEENQ